MLIGYARILLKDALQKAGRETAKKLGRVAGRKRTMTDSKLASAKKLLNSGVPPKDVAKDLGVSLATLYRWIPAN